MRRLYGTYYNIIFMKNRRKPEDIFILNSASLRNLSRQQESHYDKAVCSWRPMEVTFQKTDKMAKMSALTMSASNQNLIACMYG